MTLTFQDCKLFGMQLYQTLLPPLGRESGTETRGLYWYLCQHPYPFSTSCCSAIPISLNF